MRGFQRTSVFALALALAFLAAAGSVRAADTDRQTAQAALDQFHSALNVLFTGDAVPMKAIWSHADDTTYMGPAGGLQVGWSQIEPYWDKQAARKLGGKVVAADVHVTASPQLAVAQYHEQGENVIDGKPQPVSIRSSTVFRRENGQWKVIHHQTDALAYLQK